MKTNKLFLILIFLFGSLTMFAQDAESIRVGVILDMSGGTSGFGLSTNNGITIAVNEINARGGISGRKLQLYFEDTTGRPETAKQAAYKLTAITKVHAIIGEVASTNSLAAAYEAQEAKIPMITPSSTNPRVTEVGDYIFRVCFIDPFQGNAMARFAFTNLGVRKAVIFRDVNSDYSRGLAKTFDETFQKLGGKVLPEQTYIQTDYTYKTQLRKIRRLKPDAIYLAGYYGQVGIIAKEARQLGMNMPLLGGDGWDSPEIWKLGGTALRNSYITNHFSAEDPAIAIKSFVKKYKSEFNSTPDALAALGYDAVNVLADAISRAGSTDGAKLRDAIAKTKDFQGVTGKITINGSRNAVKPAVILRLDTKRREFVYRSTLPPDPER